MIRALLKKQLLELGAAFVRSSKTGKQRSRVGTFGYALLFTVLMLLVMLNFGAMALPMATTLVPQGLDWLYFVLMELSALTVSVLYAPPPPCSGAVTYTRYSLPPSAKAPHWAMV